MVWHMSLSQSCKPPKVCQTGMFKLSPIYKCPLLKEFPACTWHDLTNLSEGPELGVCFRPIPDKMHSPLGWCISTNRHIVLDFMVGPIIADIIADPLEERNPRVVLYDITLRWDMVGLS